MYVHICTHARAQCKHDVVYSMILRTTLKDAACISGFLSDNDKGKAMTKYSDVRNGGADMHVE